MNPFYEYDLQFYPNHYSPPEILKKSAVALYYFFLSISKKEDLVLLPKYSRNLLQIWENRDLEFGTPIQKIPEKIKNYQLIEWGSFSKIYHNEIIIDKKIIEKGKFLNSKITQVKWKNNLNLKKTLVSDKDSLDFSFIDFPVLVRKEFGFSGRGSYLVKSKNELYKNFKKKEKLIIESWIGDRKLKDYSEVVDCKGNTPIPLCCTEMFIGERNQFRGCILLDENPGISYIEQLKKVLDLSQYNGPVSIDYFSYLNNDSVDYHFCEINFRYGIGRILWELHQKQNDRGKISGIFLVSYVDSKDYSFFSKHQFLPLCPFWKVGNEYLIWIFGTAHDREGLLNRLEEVKENEI